jgi:hypothetical protein
MGWRRNCAITTEKRGDHPNWAKYDAAMIAEQRLLISMSIDHAYGQLR